MGGSSADGEGSQSGPGLLDLEPPPLPWPEVSVPQALGRVGEFRKGYSWVPVIAQELSCLGSAWRHQHGRPHGLSSSGRCLVQGSGGRGVRGTGASEPATGGPPPHPGPLPQGGLRGPGPICLWGSQPVALWNLGSIKECLL